MTTEKDHLQTLNEIRSLMEKSSRFISLSGLSGIFAGFFALIGAAAVFFFYSDFFYPRYYNMGVFLREDLIHGKELTNFITFSLIDAALILILAIGFAIFFTTRRARKNGQSIWDATSKRLIISTLIPLATGGLFCIALSYHKQIYLIAPTTLVFYGLALLNASKYTLDEIKYLGISEIIIGLIASIFVGYSLIFWAFGFGILHIVYGAIMYYKHERA
jgi:hypothetical protein